MARAIVVQFEGREVRFAPRVVTRAKLYGERKRLVLDERGAPTASGWLTTDGALLLTQGARAELYLDEHGDVVDRKELVAVDATGAELVRHPSTLDVPQPLVGPVPATRVLECVTHAVYSLEPEAEGALDPELAARLARGEIFETVFAFTAGFDESALFLLANEDGIFALAGTPVPEGQLGFVRKEAPPAPEDDGDGDDDDLDFSMF